MAFFKKKEKRLAAKVSREEIQQGYRKTENALEKAARSGSVKAVKRAMREHHTYEYAKLYDDVIKAKRAKKEVGR